MTTINAKKNKTSNLTYFGWVATAVWLLAEYRYLSGYTPLLESSSFFFIYDLFIILLISSILFFIGIYKNSTLPNKDKRDKLIGISYILICIGTFFHYVNLIIGNIFFIGLGLFLYSTIFVKRKK
tara:strand:- start:245 stop:619 length:375 start_codon:yes stop_codon:yes gene_type:complete